VILLRRIGVMVEQSRRDLPLAFAHSESYTHSLDTGLQGGGAPLNSS
jgi:hypothetical protein